MVEQKIKLTKENFNPKAIELGLATEGEDPFTEYTTTHQRVGELESNGQEVPEELNNVLIKYDKVVDEVKIDSLKAVIESLNDELDDKLEEIICISEKLELIEKFEDKQRIAAIFNELGRNILYDKTEKSLQYFDWALKMQEDYHKALFNKSWALMKLDRLEDALESCDTALEVREKDVMSIILKGLILERMGNFDEALEQYDSAIILKTSSRFAWAGKAHCLYQLSIANREPAKYEKAIQAYGEAVKLDSDILNKLINDKNVFNHPEKEEIFTKFEEARKEFFEEVRSEAMPLGFGADPHPHIRLKDIECEDLNKKGNDFYDKKEYDKALQCYEKILKIDLANLDGWRGKGLNLFGQNKYEDAIQCCEKALEIDPKNASNWNLEGHCFYGLGQYHKSAECYDKAIEIEPKECVYRTNKANALFQQKKFAEVVECCDKALEIDAKCDSAWNRKGKALRALRKYDEAITCYDMALEINPEDSTYWNNKGYALSKQENYDEAIECYNKALELDPNNDTARKNLEGLKK